VDDNTAINRRFLETDDDNDAFELLFKTYYKAIFRSIDRMLRDHSDPAVDADDLTQETFIRALQKKNEVREPEKVPGWLFTIAKNLTLNEIRDAKRRRETGSGSLKLLEDLSDSEKEAPYAAFIAKTDAEQTETNRYRLQQCLYLLQGDDRKVVELKLEGAEIREIAQTIGATSGAVQKRWERLLEWLTPIARNLEVLMDCLPEVKEQYIMERHLDGQPFSEITKALGISPATVEKTVKRVIVQWKKAAKANPADPVSALVDNER